MRLRKRNASVEKKAEELVEDASAMHEYQPLNFQKNPIEELAKNQLSTVLQNAIERLPENYRLVFLMREVEQLNTKETADSLSITTDTVKQRFSRSKKMLRDHLEIKIKESGLSLFEFGGKRCDKVVNQVLARINGVPLCIHSSNPNV